MLHKEVRLDTSAVWDLLDEVRNIASHVDLHQEVSGPFTVSIEDGRDVDNNASKAEMARELLRAAQLAGLASGELHSLYWQLKGQDDPRRST